MSPARGRHGGRLHQPGRPEARERVEGEVGGGRVQINVCYPEEIVRYYSPNYAQDLLQKLQ